MILKILAFLIPALAFASDGIRITGRIVDSETGDPIEMVNVFLANTMKGGVTDKDGRFVITDVSRGIYDLIAHHVGFEGAAVNLDLLGQPPEALTVKLKPRILAGQKVLVEAEPPKEWLRMLGVFKREFLGQSDNSRHCAILNPEFLNFEYDKSSDCFTASTDRLLKIRNNSLGYSVDLLLEKFEFQKSVVVYSIVPRFAELQPANPSENQRWVRARRTTYLGSFKHFMSCLAENRLENGGFKASGMKQDFFKDHQTPDITVTPLPGTQDAEHRFRKIHFDGCIKVSSSYFPDERAILCMKLEEAVIDTKGNVYTKFAFYKSGHWSGERVADLLPNEYAVMDE